MSEEIAMPRLSDTMEEGTILRWLKRDGEHVARGEELVEIETDKASMTYESDREGTLQTLAREGDTLPVGDPIARIGGTPAEGAGGATPPEVAPHEPTPHEATSQETAPSAASAEASGLAGGAKAARQTTAGPGAEAESGAAADAGAGGAASGSPNGAPEPRTHLSTRIKASPLARRVARDTGVDLAAISGSGPGGRIVKADVEASSATAADATKPAPASPLVDLAGAKGQSTAVELSRTQRTVARRMAESKATIPDFALTAEIEMTGCVELREELKRLSHDEAPTYNDMIVKACGLALREHPRANGSYRDGRFELHSRVNVGVAVALDAGEPSGALVVPTVFDADAKALGEIARETRALAARVREGSITPPQLGGATFTVSNLGMYGIRQFTAIVNPPQAAILAVGELASRPVARKKKLVARPTMTVTLSCDHRILYGADAALFLARVRELLGEPAALTL